MFLYKSIAMVLDIIMKNTKFPLQEESWKTIIHVLNFGKWLKTMGL